jgi:hypothetical protein
MDRTILFNISSAGKVPVPDRKIKGFFVEISESIRAVLGGTGL